MVAKPKPAASVPQSGNSAAPVYCVTAVIDTDCFSVWYNRPWWQSRSCSHREAYATPTRCVPSLSVFSLCLSVCAVDSVLYLSPPCVSKYSLLRSDMSLFERLLMCTVCLCLPVYLCLCVVVCACAAPPAAKARAPSTTPAVPQGPSAPVAVPVGFFDDVNADAAARNTTVDDEKKRKLE